MSDDQTFVLEDIADEETPTGDPADAKTGAEGEQPSGESPKGEDYKVKFTESSKEAMRLLDENKKLQVDLEAERQARQALEKDSEDLANINPDGSRLLKTEKTVEQIQKELLLEKEERELNSFVQLTPEAKSHAEALKSLGRANPKASYKDLWEKHFLPIFEAGKEASKSQRKKDTQVETNVGNQTPAPAEEHTFTVEQFNALPLEKRREFFKKMGM
jgi:hypothetical protein